MSIEFIEGLTPIEQILKETKVMILGETGIGKTQMAATFPSPIFIDMDIDGSQFVDAARVIPRDWKEFVAVVKRLEAKFKEPGCPYETIVLDTLDELVALVKRTLLGTSDKMTRGQWDQLLNKVMPMLRRLKSIEANFVICAQVKSFSAKEGAAPDVTLAIPSSAKVRVPQLVGWIFHLRLNESNEVVALTKPRRGASGLYQAKDRSGKLPETIEPIYDAFIEALRDAYAVPDSLEEEGKVQDD